MLQIAEVKLKTEITVRIFCLIKERYLQHLEPFDAGVEIGYIEHEKIFMVSRGKFFIESLQAFPLQTPVVIPLNIMFNFTRI